MLLGDYDGESQYQKFYQANFSECFDLGDQPDLHQEEKIRAEPSKELYY